MNPPEEPARRVYSSSGGSVFPGAGGGKPPGRQPYRSPQNSAKTKKRRIIDYPRTGKHGVMRWIPSWRQVLGVFLAMGALGAGVLVMAYVTTSIPEANDFVTEETTHIYYSDGESKMGSFAAQNRDIIDTEEIPDYVSYAVVSAEDRSFFDNSGVDPAGIGRAAVGIVRGGKTTGGSTITQQYVKNYYLTADRTMSRKFTEAMLAIKIDQQLSKEEILDSYLNVIYFGRGSYGIQTAAQAYFEKDAADLSVSEAAALAGIIPSPTNWDPAVNPEKAEARWNYVLDGMVEGGWLSQAERAEQEFPEVKEHAQEDRYAGPNGYLLDLVRKEVVENAPVSEEELDRGGLEITTTIDKDRQDAAVKAVENLPEGHDENLRTALVSVDPESGGIEALYGGEDYISSPRNAATQDRAQAGSTFKPFTLIAALEEGVPLSKTYSGASPMEIEGFDNEVNNYGEISYDNVDLTYATAQSINTVYGQLNVDVGPENTVDVATRAGVPEDTPGLVANPANVLGTASPHPISMTRAYTTFAAQGERTDPHIVEQVSNSNEDDLYKAPTKGERVIDEDVMAEATYAMTKVIEEGSGGKLKELNRPVAGKTGTSQKNRSAWFAGYVPQLATTVTMYQPGEDGEESITPWGDVPEVTGSTYPTDVWLDYMSEALKDTPVEEFPERPEPEEPEKELVKVPDVVGMSQDEAESKINGANLNVRISKKETDNFAPGQVAETNPGPGSEVETGTAVTLYIAEEKTEEKVTVPDVVGVQEDSAIKHLEDRDLSVNVRHEESNEPEGLVISSDPSGGSEVDPGTTVTITVSSGAPEPDPDPAPDPDPTTPDGGDHEGGDHDGGGHDGGDHDGGGDDGADEDSAGGWGDDWGDW